MRLGQVSLYEPPRNFLFDALHGDVAVLHALDGMQVHDVAPVDANEARVRKLRSTSFMVLWMVYASRV